ncbi:hypothetical protein [Mollivirus kamchatka]|nr:hypothetical protein [Mollivirus kamchatka]
MKHVLGPSDKVDGAVSSPKRPKVDVVDDNGDDTRDQQHSEDKGEDEVKQDDHNEDDGSDEEEEDKGEEDEEEGNSDNEEEEEDDIEEESQDMLTRLGRMMPEWMVKLMSMLRPRDICALMATSYRLSAEFLETNNLYRLGMPAAFGGRIHLKFGVQGKPILYTVDVALSTHTMELAVPNKVFAPGQRLVEALDAFSSQGDIWLAFMKGSEACVRRGRVSDWSARGDYDSAVRKIIIEQAAELQRRWLQAFEALNVFPCGHGARRFMATCERIIALSVNEPSLENGHVMATLRCYWDSNSTREIYGRAEVTRVPSLSLPHHMWFAPKSLVKDAAPPEVSNPLSLWIIRWMVCRFDLPEGDRRPEDPTNLAMLASCLQSKLMAKDACDNLADTVLDWASEANLALCTSDAILRDLAHVAYDTLARRAGSSVVLSCSTQALCLVVVRVCLRLKGSLMATLGDERRTTIQDTLWYWTPEPVIDSLMLVIDSEDVDNIYRTALRSISDNSPNRTRLASNLPSVVFLRTLSSRMRRAGATSLDPEHLDRMRQSLKSAFQCLNTTHSC